MFKRLTSLFRSANTPLARSDIHFRRPSQLASRFASLYHGVEYYDPYQMKQVVQEKKLSETCDNGSSQEPAKKRVRSGVDSVVQRVLNKAYTAYESFWAEKEFLPKSASLFSSNEPKMRGRGVDFGFYDNHDSYINSDINDIVYNQIRSEPSRIRIHLFSESMDITCEPVIIDHPNIIEEPVIVECPKYTSRKRAHIEINSITPAKRSSDEAWGLVDNESYEVEFLTAPPKPKRTFLVNSTPSRNRILTPYDHYRYTQHNQW
ncbi:hypothetical protein BDB01DRAFT_831936 [Pilobolus umbonatus]|nr:hypothetical protein BDB01DRAFT_831936 [Pilobolus umbonatus]